MLILTGLTCLKGVVGFQAHSDSLLAAAAQSAAGICVAAAAVMRVRTMRMQLAGASFRGLDKRSSVGSILLIVLIMARSALRWEIHIGQIIDKPCGS